MTEPSAPLLGRLQSIYFPGGRFTGALLEDLILATSILVGLFSLLSHERDLAEGFFDGVLTFATLSIAALVMVVYHFLWRVLETRQGGHGNLQRECWYEQIPRFCAALSLLVGLYNFSKNLPLFVASLVLFYLFLVVWHLVISADMRKVRGTVAFDCFGLVCAVGFAWFAIDLYLKSQFFWRHTFPSYATDTLSADVVRRSFGGTQTNLVYMMGLFAGAMVANAILAFTRGSLKTSP